MTPNVPSRDKARQLATVSPLSAVLLVPIPKYRPQKRTLWDDFLSDLRFVLLAFGTVLGALLALGQAPFLGATLVTLCPIILTMRIYAAYDVYRERRRLAALEKWYRANRRRC
jgi:hypothetical protein